MVRISTGSIEKNDDASCYSTPLYEHSLSSIKLSEHLLVSCNFFKKRPSIDLIKAIVQRKWKTHTCIEKQKKQIIMNF